MLRLRNTRTEIQKACLASKPSPSKSKVDPGLPDFSHSSPVRLPIRWEQCSPSDYLFTVVNVTMVNVIMDNVIDYFLSLSRQISANCKMGPKSNSFFLIDVKYEVGECQTSVGIDYWSSPTRRTKMTSAMKIQFPGLCSLCPNILNSY